MGTEKSLSDAALASIAQLGNQNVFKDAKARLEGESSQDVHFTIVCKGTVTKSAPRTKDESNKAVNPSRMLAALIEELTETGVMESVEGGLDGVVRAAAARVSDAAFSERYHTQGGDKKLHTRLAALLEVPEFVQKSVAGSVSAKNVVVVDAYEGDPALPQDLPREEPEGAGVA